MGPRGPFPALVFKCPNCLKRGGENFRQSVHTYNRHLPNCHNTVGWLRFGHKPSWGLYFHADSRQVKTSCSGKGGMHLLALRLKRLTFAVSKSIPQSTSMAKQRLIASAGLKPLMRTNARYTIFPSLVLRATILAIRLTRSHFQAKAHSPWYTLHNSIVFYLHAFNRLTCGLFLKAQKSAPQKILDLWLIIGTL